MKVKFTFIEFLETIPLIKFNNSLTNSKQCCPFYKSNIPLKNGSSYFMQGMVERCGGENAPGAVSTIHMKKAGMLMDYSRSFCRMKSKKNLSVRLLWNSMKVPGIQDPLSEHLLDIL